MRFKFYGSNGGAIDLTVINPKTMIQIPVETAWKIENSYELIISAPKYVGYRMGRLKRSDNGVSLCRANNVAKDGNYEFSCLDAFRDFGGVETHPFIPPPFKVDYNSLHEAK